MSTELAKIEITPEQRDLIKKTIAQGATDDELRLFFYDCQRRGIHPLDKLIHFTKRSGKYTPVTSIDLMRIRAADSGEYAGNDDAVFTFGDDPKYPQSAVVTVWRLVAGVRCPFTATARWSEYVPQDAFMWKKMPCTMLGKCAEALALRKGFPAQLSGLYAKEEMDQAGSEPKMTPQEAQAFVKQQMDALKGYTALPLPSQEAQTARAYEIVAGAPHQAIPAEITQESQDNYVPYEEAENEARFTFAYAEKKNGRNGEYRKVFWREGAGSCFFSEEFATIDSLKAGAVITAEIKRKGDYINIVRIIHAGGSIPEPQYDDSALFVGEDEGARV